MLVLPLPAGHVLADRFEIDRVLGHGGFGIAYVATDLARGDQVVVKELAPTGSKRRNDGFLELNCGTLTPQLLRNRFAEEANRLTKLNVVGVLPVRATVAENGTVYYATAYEAEAETLEHVLTREGRFDVEGAVQVLVAMLDILEGVHRQGMLHRDIKPSNILLTPSSSVILIDFGAAREFLVDADITHTVMLTPAYAPPEQVSERARRGPYTDIYALSATIYTLLVGRPPAEAAERMAGEKLVPLREFRLELSPQIAAVIEQGLSLAVADRPQTAAEMRQRIDSVPELEPVTDLDALDVLLARSQAFTFHKRACPACQGVLNDPKPLRRLQCPTCQKGAIRRRPIVDGVCPSCRTGPLRRISNTPQLHICPACQATPLTYRRKGLLKPIVTATCPECALAMTIDAENLVANEVAQPPEAWLQSMDRQTVVMFCRDCKAQYDEMPDGRWQRVRPTSGSFSLLYPDEWARVAAGLDPGVGNAECDSCAADYFLDGDSITLLAAHEDLFGFAQSYLGRIVKIEDVRWLAVGKESPNAGFVCEGCLTEFDRDGNYLRLVHSPNRDMSRLAGAPKTLEDWHRIAAELPTVDQESGLDASLTRALRAAYREGQANFDDRLKLAWKGEATFNGDVKGSLAIDEQELSFGGRFRRAKVPLDAMVAVSGRGRDFYIQWTGERESDHYEIEPVELTALLRSGARSITLDASDLAARLSRSAKSGV